jgi:hypothetical protein
LRSSTGSLAIATDEEDFVRQAASWLARSNAEGVLDRSGSPSRTQGLPKPPLRDRRRCPGGSEQGG